MGDKKINVFDLLAPEVKKIVEKRFAKPTPIQQLAIPEMLKGRNLLILSNTGSGKTESCLFPVFSGLVKEDHKPISALYICPLRSLNRDLLKRVLWWANKLEFEVGVRHGDTTPYERSMQAENPPAMLITTPETLQAVLTGKRMREHLKNIKYCVVDEVHELVDNKRGIQLSAALARLRELITAGGRPEPQVVGLSATVGSPELIARFLTDRPCKVLNAVKVKELGIKVECPEPTQEDSKIGDRLFTSPALTARLRLIDKLIRERRSVLVFTNTRESAEILSSRLKVFDPELPLDTHHSSLSKEVRVQAESDFKDEKLKAMVCVGKNSRILSSDCQWKTISTYSKVPNLISINGMLKAENDTAKIIIKNGKKRLFRLTSNLGFEIEATNEHKFLTIDKVGDIKWARLGELNEGCPVGIVKKSLAGKSKFFLDILSGNIYIKFSKRFREKLKISVQERYKTYRVATRIAKCPRGTLSNTLNKNSAIKLGAVKRLLKELGIEFESSRDISYVGSRNYTRYKLPKRITADFTRFIGFLLADGTITRDDMLRLFNKNKAILDKFKNILKKEFGLKCNLLRGPNCLVLQTHATWLSSTLNREGVVKGRRARIVHIPNFIFTLPEEQRFGFLTGYFDGDGNIEVKKGRLVSIVFNTYSKKMAKDLQLLLLGLGIVSSLRDDSERGKGYHVAILGGEHIQRFAHNCKSWKTDFSRFNLEGGYSNLDTVPNLGSILRDLRLKAGLSTYSMQKKFKNPIRYELGTRFISRKKLNELIGIYSKFIKIPDSLKILLTSDVFFDRIKKIEQTGRDSVYDVIDCKNNNFVADGFIVHNCTSSLELGIDIGSIDFILQYMSPRQTVKLLQRVGRSGHTLREVSSGMIVAQDAGDCFESAVIARNALEGWVEPSKVYRDALDVLGHQIVGLALEEYKMPLEKAYRIIKNAQPFSGVDKEGFLEVCRFMQKLGYIWVDSSKPREEPFGLRHKAFTETSDGGIGTGADNPAGSDVSRHPVGNEQDLNTMFLKRRRKAWEYYYSNLSTIPDVRNYKIFDVVKNMPVGSLDAEFIAMHGAPGTSFICKGRAWKILEVQPDRIIVEPTQGIEGAIPAWEGELIPVPCQIAQGVGKLRGEIAARLDSGAEGFLRDSLPITEGVARKLVETVRGQAQWGFVPTDKELLVEWGTQTQRERRFLERELSYIVMHTCWGSLVNETLGRALSILLMNRLGSVGLQTDPYRIVLKFSSPAEPEARSIVDMLKELKPDTLETVLRLAMPGTELFRWRFLHIAKRFGIIARGADFGKGYLQKIISAYRDTPVYKEAFREIWQEKLDLEASVKVLRDIQDGRVRMEIRPGLSPLGKAALMSRYEIVASERPEHEIFSAFKERLLDTKVRLVCCQCGWAINYPVRDAPETPKCLACGARLMGVIKPWDTDKEILLKRFLKKGQEGLTEGEMKTVDSVMNSASLVVGSGRDAVTALAGRGVGPRTAGRILAGMKKGDELLKDVLEAERTFFRTKQFWH